jgi:hypothetical protein
MLIGQLLHPNEAAVVMVADRPAARRVQPAGRSLL